MSEYLDLELQWAALVHNGCVALARSCVVMLLSSLNINDVNLLGSHLFPQPPCFDQGKLQTNLETAFNPMSMQMIAKNCIQRPTGQIMHSPEIQAKPE